MLDGVFNHVGRGFWAFQDVLEKKWDSPYKDWFYINFDGNSAYNDGFWYEGWEGHYELVKLNLQNPAVTDHLLSCIKMWIETSALTDCALMSLILSIITSCAASALSAKRLSRDSLL